VPIVKSSTIPSTARAADAALAAYLRSLADQRAATLSETLQSTLKRRHAGPDAQPVHLVLLTRSDRVSRAVS
jgi:hypothetical protein